MSTSDFQRPPDPARTCWTCRWWLENLPGAVACGRAPPVSGRWVRSQPENGCVWWEREMGADDGLTGG